MRIRSAQRRAHEADGFAVRPDSAPPRRHDERPCALPRDSQRPDPAQPAWLASDVLARDSPHRHLHSERLRQRVGGPYDRASKESRCGPVCTQTGRSARAAASDGCSGSGIDADAAAAHAHAGAKQKVPCALLAGTGRTLDRVRHPGEDRKLPSVFVRRSRVALDAGAQTVGYRRTRAYAQADRDADARPDADSGPVVYADTGSLADSDADPESYADAV